MTPPQGATVVVGAWTPPLASGAAPAVRNETLPWSSSTVAVRATCWAPVEAVHPKVALTATCTKRCGPHDTLAWAPSAPSWSLTDELTTRVSMIGWAGLVSASNLGRGPS